jgi:hypothetical protein
MQRDELVTEILSWADRAERHLAAANEIHEHLAEMLSYANEVDRPTPGDQVALRVTLAAEKPPLCLLTAIVPPWPEHGLTETGYVVLVEPGRHQICTAGDFLVVR